jgi:hypothetical protein
VPLRRALEEVSWLVISGWACGHIVEGCQLRLHITRIALVANPVREHGVGAAGNIVLQLLPLFPVVADFLAIGTDREQALKLLDLALEVDDALSDMQAGRQYARYLLHCQTQVERHCFQDQPTRFFLPDKMSPTGRKDPDAASLFSAPSVGYRGGAVKSGKSVEEEKRVLGVADFARLPILALSPGLEDWEGATPGAAAGQAPG